MLFLSAVIPEKRLRLLWIPVGLNAALSATAFFTDLVFAIRNNTFYRGPLGYTCLILTAALIVTATALVFIHCGGAKNRESAVLFVNGAMILAAAAADTFLISEPQPASCALKVTIGCAATYYSWARLQLTRRHERELIEHMQAEQRIRIMVSQIQPHFLFNTLSTIQALCRIDPEKAFDTVEKFGQYLRQNIDSLNRAELIPFEKEIEHTRIYAEIERIRFPSTRITYDLEDMNFRLPALTVQPLVENAIRHGVRIRSHGEVAVITRREGDDHVIVIRDNGKGFDVESALNADSSHIGIRNVRSRIEQMCGGSLRIDSRIGEGTTVTIRIPAGKENR